MKQYASTQESTEATMNKMIAVAAEDRWITSVPASLADEMTGTLKRIQLHKGFRNTRPAAPGNGQRTAQPACDRPDDSQRFVRRPG